MNINKAFENQFESKRGIPYKSYRAFSKGQPPEFSELDLKEDFTAGAEYGTKQARIKTLEEVKVILHRASTRLRPQDFTVEYVDTELAKLRND